MSFEGVRINARSRFADLAHLNALIEGQEGVGPADPTPDSIKAIRGLYYVSLYAAFEKSINECVEQALLLIGSKGVKNCHYHIVFNSISLHPKMQSFKTSGFSGVVLQSADLFSSTLEESIPRIENTLFSKSLQNVWYNSLDETLKCLGAPPMNATKGYKSSIDEVVGKRNAVAHGRSSAVEVGAQSRLSVLRQRAGEVLIVFDEFVDIMDNYISECGYIAPGSRPLYMAPAPGA